MEDDHLRSRLLQLTRKETRTITTLTLQHSSSGMQQYETNGLLSVVNDHTTIVKLHATERVSC